MLRPRTSSRTCPANTRYDSQSGLCVSETTDQDPDVVGKKRNCASPYQWISPTSDGKCVPKQPEDDERSKRCPAGQVFLSTIGCACPGGGNACKRRTVYYTRTPTEPAPAPEPAPVPEVQPEVCVTYTIQRRNPDRKIKSETSGTTRAPSTDELLEGDTIVFYLTTTPAEASKPVKQANVRYRYIRTGSGHQTVRPSPDPHRPKRQMLNQYSNWNVYSVRVGGTEPRVKKFAVFTIKDDHRPDHTGVLSVTLDVDTIQKKYTIGDDCTVTSVKIVDTDDPVLFGVKASKPIITEGEKAQILIGHVGRANYSITDPRLRLRVVSTLRSGFTYNSTTYTGTDPHIITLPAIAGDKLPAISDQIRDSGDVLDWLPLEFGTIQTPRSDDHGKLSVSIYTGNSINYKPIGGGCNENPLTPTYAEFCQGYKASTEILIEDSSPPPEATLTAPPVPTVTEGNTAEFKIKLNRSTTETVTVNAKLTVSNSHQHAVTITNPVTITIPTNTTDATLRVPVTDDNYDNGNGSLLLTLQPGEGYTLPTTTQAVSYTIIDNDEPPQWDFSLSPDTITSASGTTNITITIEIKNTPPTAWTQDQIFTMSIANDPSNVITSTVKSNGQMRFPANHINDAKYLNMGTITVTPSNECETGENPSVKVTVTGPSGGPEPASKDLTVTASGVCTGAQLIPK